MRLTHQNSFSILVLLNERTSTVLGSEKFRYGFQNQEMDDEIKGDGNSVNYKYRMHDPRLGRFFAVDPLASSFPWNSPYAFSENKVINAVELEGLESVFVYAWNNKEEHWVSKYVYTDERLTEDFNVYVVFDKINGKVVKTTTQSLETKTKATIIYPENKSKVNFGISKKEPSVKYSKEEVQNHENYWNYSFVEDVGVKSSFFVDYKYSAITNNGENKLSVQAWASSQIENPDFGVNAQIIYEGKIFSEGIVKRSSSEMSEHFDGKQYVGGVFLDLPKNPTSKVEIRFVASMGSTNDDDRIVNSGGVAVSAETTYDVPLNISIEKKPNNE